MDKFVIVEPGHNGPKVWHYSTIEEMAKILVTWAGRYGLHLNHGSQAWQRIDGEWVPMWTGATPNNTTAGRA